MTQSAIIKINYVPTVSATAWQILKIQSAASSSLKAARAINGDPSSATTYDKTTDDKIITGTALRESNLCKDGKVTVYLKSMRAVGIIHSATTSTS